MRIEIIPEFKYITMNKPTKAEVVSLEKAGLIADFNFQYGYIEGDYKPNQNAPFLFMGKIYMIQYRSGCFNPFLVRLDKMPENGNLNLITTYDKDGTRIR
jgi:hypothetical protein